MFGLIDNLARRLVRHGFRRGILEGNALWVVVGAIALVVRLLARPEPDKVVREKLKVGETITVSHLPPPPTARQLRKSRS